MILMPFSSPWLALGAVVTLYFLGLNMTLSVLPLFVEGELGGTVANARPQGRWRSAMFFDLQRGDETLPMYFRGHRPGLGPASRRQERRLLAACPPLELVFLTAEQQGRMRAAMGAAMDRHRDMCWAMPRTWGP